MKQSDTTNYIPVSNELGEKLFLTCPVCGGINVHPMVVRCVHPGNDKGIVVIDYSGVSHRPDAEDSEAYRRGVLVELKFFCEEGHTFDYGFQFYKGNTIVGKKTGKFPNNIKQWPKDIATIWRN